MATKEEIAEIQKRSANRVPLTLSEKGLAAILTIMMVIFASLTNRQPNQTDIRESRPSSTPATTALFPEKRGFIVNQSPALSETEREALNIELSNYWKSSGNTLLVLVTDDIGENTIESFAHQLFDKWRPGKEKTDNGMILVISPRLRKSRLEVGYGLEGSIPDILAKKILDTAGKSYFKNGDYLGGISHIIKSVDAKAEIFPPKNRGVASSENHTPPEAPFGLALVILFFAAFLIPNFWQLSWPIYIIFFPTFGFFFGQHLITYTLATYCATYYLISNRKNNLGMYSDPNRRGSSYGNTNSDSWSSSDSSSSSSGDSGGDSGGGGSSSSW